MELELSVVLLQGDLTERATEIYGAFGLELRTTAAHALPGAFVHRMAAQVVRESRGPALAVGLAASRGWTVVSDPSGQLVEDFERWQEISRQLDTRVLLLRRGLDETEIIEFRGGELTRLTSWEGDECIVSRGRPLAGEGEFILHVVDESEGAGAPGLETLVAVAEAEGVDLLEINRRASFRVDALGPATDVAHPTPRVALVGSSPVADDAPVRRDGLGPRRHFSVRARDGAPLGWPRHADWSRDSRAASRAVLRSARPLRRASH